MKREQRRERTLVGADRDGARMEWAVERERDRDRMVILFKFEY